MVTVNNKIGAGGSATFEFLGLSGDTKPTGKWGGTGTKKGETIEIVGAQEIANNSLFLELDTGNIYYYMDGAWSEMGNNSSSGWGGNIPVPTSDDNGKILGVDDGGYKLLEHYKPTYVFGFTVESDGQGGYVATADTGVTYKNITDALAITDNVMAKVNVLGLTYRTFICDDPTNHILWVTASLHSNIFNAPIVITLRIAQDDTLTPYLDVLATASP